MSAGSAAYMGRRRRHNHFVCPRRHARAAAHGRHHRWRTQTIRPLLEVYREAGRSAGHPAEKLTVGLHSISFLADTTQQAADDSYPGYVGPVHGVELRTGSLRPSAFLANLSERVRSVVALQNNIHVRSRRNGC
jgi:hypothetical protein